MEPVCATTQSSLKDPTVNMTRPSVRDMEVSFATVPALEWSKKSLLIMNSAGVTVRIPCVGLQTEALA